MLRYVIGRLSLLPLLVCSFGLPLPLAADEAAPMLHGTRLPAEIQGAKIQEVVDFEKKVPGGGTGAHYSGQGRKISLYVYETADPSWLSLSLTERARREIAAVGGVFRELERRGTYADVRVAPAEEVVRGDLHFTLVRLGYTEKDEVRLSRFYLGVLGDRLFKIRLTVSRDKGDKAMDACFEEVVALFGGRGAGVGKSFSAIGPPDSFERHVVASR